MYSELTYSTILINVLLSGFQKIPEAPTSNFLLDVQPTLPQRRTAVPPKPSYRLNYWSIMKNCIGKDLSKIPMPVRRSPYLQLLCNHHNYLQYYTYKACVLCCKANCVSVHTYYVANKASSLVYESKQSPLV